MIPEREWEAYADYRKIDRRYEIAERIGAVVVVVAVVVVAWILSDPAPGAFSIFH
jgi:hypothetical protein